MDQSPVTQRSPRLRFASGVAFPVLELVLLAAIFYADYAGLIPLSKTPVIVALGTLSFWMRGRSWKDGGFAEWCSWKTLGYGAILGVALAFFSILVTQPILKAVTGGTPDLSDLKDIEGNIQLLFIFFGLNWVLAAFGEEMSYRGYLLTRVLDLFSKSRAAEWACVTVVGILFGVAHFWQGPIGMTENAVNGVLFGAIYLATGRNLWFMIALHGVSNMVDFTMIFYGVYPGVK